MIKSKFLMTLACMSLLLAGCNGNKSSAAPSSSKSSVAPTTAAQSSAEESSAEEENELHYDAECAEADGKWEKGKTYTWEFTAAAAHAEVTFAFAAQMSSSSHSDRSLYTDHNGASSSDSFESNEENDGTPRITITANGVAQTVTEDTYGDAGLDASELHFFKVAKFAVAAGKVTVEMTTHAQTGYRLILGPEARLYYPKA